MEQLSKIDTEILPEEVKKELLMFYEFLLYKESPNKKKAIRSISEQKEFNAISLDTRGFKFNRDEANER